MRGVSVPAAYVECRTIARRAAGTFYLALRLLPEGEFDAICALYAYSRLCDDAVDGAEADPAELDRILDRLGAAYDGRPEGPIFVALADAADRYDIPKDYLETLVDGVRADLSTTRYETFEDLSWYCYQVASVVGLACLRIFGGKGEEAEDRAIDLGVGMQLVNIARDVAEDASRGRIYIPQEEIRKYGCTEQGILEGRYDGSFRRLMAFQVRRAREYLARGRELLPCVPGRARACPDLLSRLYGNVLDRIEAVHYDVFTHRARVPWWTKLRLGLSALRASRG